MQDAKFLTWYSFCASFHELMRKESSQAFLSFMSMPGAMVIGLVSMAMASGRE
jgi:hypothetical protein